ncbi:MAG: indole-3-glycerol phosphate synthase TrpC [Vallitalea sp.]|nr:indole-3-glycerol phosphate synthase TrpC [Vallitalea sp.]
MSVPSILINIINMKQQKLNELKKEISERDLRYKIKSIPQRPSFYEAIKKDGLSIIGEVKKASPSKGIIKTEFEPIKIAKQYEKVVDAISVLTEEAYFKGHAKYLQDISKQVNIPLLRKDFIIDSIQIYEAKLLGASAVLLIAAILDEKKLQNFLAIAKSLAMDALVEVHNEKELEMVLKTDAVIIGINNRNLHTFEVNIDTTIKLRKMIPDDMLVISESGIFTGDDIKRLCQVKIDGILVGESFMRSKSIPLKAEEFRNAYSN